MSRKNIRDAKYHLSRETGTVFKDWGGRLPIALIYPNSYYIGMSNLGIHTIYGLLNSYGDTVCERVFRETENKTGQTTPFSLESQRPLADFAVLAFSITYELDYFNVVNTLKASGIPLYAADRNERHPLVIAGGPCIIANPMPLSPFFDCLCIGEAEPILPSILPVLPEGIKGKRSDLLRMLASLPGIYVPQAHNGTPVARQWLQNLDDFPAHTVILTPDTELGSLYLIEVQRGCGWGCRFCLVSNAFSPLRFRSIDSLITQAEQGLRYRKRIGLVGPAVTDHPRFEDLLSRLQQMGGRLSVSSLRVKPLSSTVLREVARGGTQTIALAPEAGSERLRRLIRKGVSEDDILEAVNIVAGEDIKQLKLYFMIGLPSETDDDIEEINRLTLTCKRILDTEQAGSRIILSIAPFVPKAGTPFQWLPMEKLPVLKQRLSLLKNTLQPRGIKIKGDSLAWSQVQGILARGDSSIAGVLANTEDVSLSGWRNALRECQIDTDYFLHQRWDTADKVPWSVIASVAETSHLQTELARALG